jgi:uncharacterized protein (UPF0332 family)
MADAKEMMQAKLSPRSITNRAYYTMFYTLLALFLGAGIHLKTSKHVGVISIFDREFVHTGKVDVKYSKALHKVFDLRLESDYRELADISVQDATEAPLPRSFFRWPCHSSKRLDCKPRQSTILMSSQLIN